LHSPYKRDAFGRGLRNNGIREKTEPINGVAHSPGEACADRRGAYAASSW